MSKTELRSLFLRQRRQLSTDTLNALSLAISQTFFANFSLTHLTNLHIYLPMVKNHEINTWFIIRKIWQDYPHLTVVTSKTNWQEGSLQSYRLEENTLLQENRWGVPEPVNASPFADDQLDMMLLPLLGFDRQGYRVGYGKGFYDRFLSQCRPTLIKIGLSFFDPVEEIGEVHEGDVKLNFCITPHQVFAFPSNQ